MSSMYICIVISCELQFMWSHLFCKCFFVIKDVESGKSSCFIIHPCSSPTCRKLGLKKRAGAACFQHPALVMQGPASPTKSCTSHVGYPAGVWGCGPGDTAASLHHVLPEQTSPKKDGPLKLWVHSLDVYLLPPFSFQSLHHLENVCFWGAKTVLLNFLEDRRRMLADCGP